MQLPKIKDIGLSGDTVYMRLSAPASSIRIISQNGTVVDSAFNTDRIRYAMATSDPYVRITAWYDDGTTVYTNAFARFSDGSSPYRSPYRDFPHPIRWGMTILWNLLLLAVAAASATGIYFLFRKKRK